MVGVLFTYVMVHRCSDVLSALTAEEGAADAGSAAKPASLAPPPPVVMYDDFDFEDTVGGDFATAAGSAAATAAATAEIDSWLGIQ